MLQYLKLKFSFADIDSLSSLTEIVDLSTSNPVLHASLAPEKVNKILILLLRHLQSRIEVSLQGGPPIL